MFDQTFVDEGKKTKEPFAFAVSVLFQVSVVALLLLVPLIYTQALPTAQLKSLLTVPSSPTAPPKPPVEVKPQQRVVTARKFSALLAPVTIPKQINRNIQELQAAPEVPVPGLETAGSGANDSIIQGMIGSVPGPPPPLTPAQPAKPKPAISPLRIATGVAEANLVHRVMPIYPPLAKSERVQGTVEFTAVINKEGQIENLRLVRGHPLLVEGAREAVLQWRYRPTLLNGQPVEVVTDIIVNFTLSQ